jgi:hypothetical protein
MVWSAWTRKPAVAVTTAVGLDVNSSRARAAVGLPWDPSPRALPLADLHVELPLLISFEQRTPAVGWPGYRLLRVVPHLVRRDFLNEFGALRERTAAARFQAADAVALLAQQLRREMPAGHAVALVTPAYLTPGQAAQLTDALIRAEVNVVGSAAAPLGLAATISSPFGTALVLDADEHALTWSVMISEGHNVRLLASHSIKPASVRVWFDRLIDAVSDRCVRLCRRDPRDSAAAEQSLFEQLDSALNAPRKELQVTLNLRTEHWFQELKVSLEDFEHFTATLARLAVDGMRQVAADAHTAAPVMARPDVLLVTADAARLPGLVAAATQNVPEPTTIRVLSADALAVAGHALAGHCLRGDLGGAHNGAAIPRFMADGKSRRGDTRSQRSEAGG